MRADCLGVYRYLHLRKINAEQKHTVDFITVKLRWEDIFLEVNLKVMRGVETPKSHVSSNKHVCQVD